MTLFLHRHARPDSPPPLMAKRALSKSKDHLQLKPWNIEAVGEQGSWLKITCPQKECGGVAYVKAGKWLHEKRQRRVIGRSCTYCFRTARVPGSDE